MKDSKLGLSKLRNTGVQCIAEVRKNYSITCWPQPFVISMTDLNADIDAIRRLAEDWSAGRDNGDVEALLSLYTDDPILLPQGQQQVIGKDAIGSQYQFLFSEFTIKGSGEVLEIEVSGDLGYFWSHYTLTAIPKSGGEQVAGKGHVKKVLTNRSSPALYGTGLNPSFHVIFNQKLLTVSIC